MGIKVCAVSYLNTAPLVWGMVYGPQQGRFDLTFRIPAECADAVASGEADIGIIPSFELLRQQVEIVPGLGIASRGRVRSILLVSKVPAAEVRSLAADSSSRTSVNLARVVLERRYGARPVIKLWRPVLDEMLAHADAALLIGDPALRVDVEQGDYLVYDLGAEWTGMTGLPMVFAVWAGRGEVITPEIVRVFQDSCRYGLEHLDDIARQEAAPRGIPEGLAREYIHERIVYEFGAAEYEGMRRFLELARFDRAAASLIK